MPSPQLPSKIGAIVFPGFQLLDFAGPIDALNILSRDHPMTLHVIASSLDPVPTWNSVQAKVSSAFSQSIQPTHTFATADRDYDVLLLPGGLGSRDSANDGVMNELVGWLNALKLENQDDGGAGAGVKWMLTVCTGSEILARTGLLNGRRATTNKRAFNEVRVSSSYASHFRSKNSPNPQNGNLRADTSSGQSGASTSQLGCKSTMGCRRKYLDEFRDQCGYGLGVCLDCPCVW